MIFKDRLEAGEKLAMILEKLPETKGVVIISLLRGGSVLGSVISKKLGIKHLPLVVTKIPAPFNPELALGAFCFDSVYLEPTIISSLRLDKKILDKQVLVAKEKFNDYLKRFSVKKTDFKQIKNQTTVVVDDGIATGATIKTAILFLQKLNPKKIVLASPVAPLGFNLGQIKINKTIILHQSPVFSAVSQFYKNFPPVEDSEIIRLLNNS